ncbi:argininosuccinate lyase [Actinokineospora sp. NBRC 105648]|nr:argininosuccinate lyase [Actinokineospora sp. NBRC 105648]
MLLVGGASPIASSRDIVGDALRQARDRGVRTHVLGRPDQLAATAEITALADAVSAADPEDPADCARWARAEAARGTRFDLVLGLRDPVLAATAACAEVFGVPGNPPEAIARTRDKDVCRAALAAAGFPQPAVRLCRDEAAAAEFLAASRGPWVVKPRAGMGSVGVRGVAGPDDLPAAVAGLPDREPFLVEEFVSGPEFSAEGVFLGGAPRVLAVTAKDKLPPPWFVESGHVLPAELPEHRRAEAEKAVCGALTALGLRSGVFHVEFWLRAGEVVLGEVHARPGGDWLHRLLTAAVPGLELFGLLYDDLLGVGPPADLRPTRAGAVRFLVAEPGELLDVAGWDRVRLHPAVLHADLSVHPGDVVAPVRDSGGRAGVVVVGAADPAAAAALADDLADGVRFTVR